jgi:hypothetical protein
MFVAIEQSGHCARGKETDDVVCLENWHRLSVPVPTLDPAGGSNRVLGRSDEGWRSAAAR